MRRHLLLALLALALAVVPARAADPVPTLEDWFSLSAPFAPDPSPDGSRVVFVVRERNADNGHWTTHLRLVSSAGGAVLPLTHGASNDSGPRWSPDGRWIAYLSEDDSHVTLRLMPMDGGEPRDLVSVGTRITSFAWMPDALSLVYVAVRDRPAAEREQRRQAASHGYDQVREEEDLLPHDVWRVTVPDGSPTLLWHGNPGITDVTVAPDGQTLALVGNRTGRSDTDDAFAVTTLDLKTHQSRRITPGIGGRAPIHMVEPPDARGEVYPAWSPDSNHLAYLAHVEPGLLYSRADVYLTSKSGGLAQDLTAPLDRSAGRLRWPWRSPRFFFDAQDRTNGRIYVGAPGTASHPIALPDGDWSDFAPTPDGKNLVAIYDGPTTGPDVWWIPVDQPEKARRLTDLNPQMRHWQLAHQEVIHWTGAGATPIEGLFVHPLQPLSQPPPLILVVHGGPFGANTNRARQFFCFQWLAAHGYAVFAPNFRGSDGYGNRFCTENRNDLGGGDYRDIMAGVDDLVARKWVDPEQMAVAGGSYGGYMTNWIIGHTDRFKAAVSLYGIFNLTTDFGCSNIPGFETDYLGHYYWENPDQWLAHSPGTYAAHIHTPVLILHGEADANTFIANSKEMFTALRKLGRTVQFWHYPREDHGLDNEAHHRMDAMRRMLAWIDRYLRGGVVDAPYESRHDGWRLSVASLGPYSGSAPPAKGHWVRLLVRINAPPQAAPEKFVVGGDGGMLWLSAPDGTRYLPAGMSMNSLDAPMLLQADAFRFTLKPADDAPSAWAINAVFDMPENVTRVRVHVGEFPELDTEVDR
ncbi:MAG: S9 family peptidase [Candidatus Xenobia bacterium]